MYSLKFFPPIRLTDIVHQYSSISECLLRSKSHLVYSAISDSAINLSALRIYSAISDMSRSLRQTEVNPVWFNGIYSKVTAYRDCSPRIT